MTRQEREKAEQDVLHDISAIESIREHRDLTDEELDALYELYIKHYELNK